MLAMVVVSKPPFVNFSVYFPGATLGNAYCPEELVVTVLVSLVAEFVRSTAASGTTAPPGWLTVPSTTPVLAGCPAADTPLQIRKRIKRPANVNRANTFISPPPQAGSFPTEWPSRQCLPPSWCAKQLFRKVIPHNGTIVSYCGTGTRG